MSDETLNGAAPVADAQPQGPLFTVEKLYVKDLSFEAPNAPQVFNEQGQPDLQMKLNQKVQRLAYRRRSASLITTRQMIGHQAVGIDLYAEYILELTKITQVALVVMPMAVRRREVLDDQGRRWAAEDDVRDVLARLLGQ